ncbi:hypothetical protein CLV24_12079 [Pontibacter ummariensis]|uniref:LTXXQ motif family protein n=1 Tax=Pontibacter ummariensis TaxID=1610492 RepID=A0A239J750_9BACT|nr:hypothetical protein [Pontibacter ummariensis]PRY08911.1 hypothetical protein CLV24_12079 [Pontibacter ummariensis]SNT01599.1 hypothetical protein SAMN06296052_12078 [Pontibacter ummariensis]
MKRYTILFLLFCAFTLSGTEAMAQEHHHREHREKVEAAKVAFLTDKLGLTAEQAQKFWPLYNEYESKRRALIHSYREGYRRDLSTLSEQEAKARIDNMFVVKERELELEKEYATKYQRIISNKQLIQLYRGEREFTKMLLKRLDNKAVSSN